MSYQVPELLSPAGSLEKLKVAINYGADAVYLGGQEFGLRVASDNFTYGELKEGTLYAHERGAKVFVVLNSFLHDDDLIKLPEFINYLNEIKIDAVIVSDLGVIKTFKKHSNIPIHLSTQASCLNIAAAKFWQAAGVTRVVLGREVSIKEAELIKMETGLEVELFVHGSMCMAYSGNCTISNFTQGRDSNRGGCAHSCRFEYSLDFPDKNQKARSYFMSSKDLNGIKLLENYIDSKIDSIKIEGRMKSPIYAATTAKVYSQALKFYQKNGHFLSEDMLSWEEELTKISHRSYTEASLTQKAGHDSIFDERESKSDIEYKNIGIIKEVVKNQFLVLEVKNAFNVNDTLEILTFNDRYQSVKIDRIRNLLDENLERTKPNTLVKVPYNSQTKPLNIVRMKV